MMMQNFPGFTQNRYQQILTSAETFITTHLPSYDENKTIAIDLDFPKPWNPSTATLVLDVKFTQTDGKTKLIDGDIPVNYLPFSWFKMLKIMVQNTTTPINNSEDGLREKCLFNMMYDTTVDYRELVLADYLAVPTITTTSRRDNKVVYAKQDNVLIRANTYSKRLIKVDDLYRMEIDLATNDKFFCISRLLDASLKFRL